MHFPESMEAIVGGQTVQMMQFALQQRRAEVNGSRELFASFESTAAPSRSADVATLWTSRADDGSSSSLEPEYVVDDVAAAIPTSSVCVVTWIALLSLCSSLLNLSTFSKYKDLQTGARQVLAMASLVDIGTSLLYLSSLHPVLDSLLSSTDLTVWLPIGINLSQQCSMLVNVAFVCRTYFTVVHGFVPMPRFLELAAALSVGVPTLAFVVAVGVSQNSSDWLDVQIVLMEPVRWMAIVLIVYLCQCMKRHVHKEVTSSNSQYGTFAAMKAVLSLQYKMNVYPSLFALVNVPLTLKSCAFVAGWVSPWLWPTSVLLAVSYQGQSLVNFVLFCLMSERVRSRTIEVVMYPMTVAFAQSKRSTTTAVPCKMTRSHSVPLSLSHTLACPQITTLPAQDDSSLTSRFSVSPRVHHGHSRRLKSTP